MRPSARDLAPAARGVALGLGVSTHPFGVALTLVALGAAALGVARPPLMVVGMCLSILFDRLGATGAAMGVVPVTMAKITVAATGVLWVVHVALGGARIFRPHPVLGALLGMIATTAFCASIAFFKPCVRTSTRPFPQ